MNWLPSSGYIHDNRPEIEVYHEGTGVYVGFWLPIKKKIRIGYRRLIRENNEVKKCTNCS